jgi:hypothetical protein
MKFKEKPENHMNLFKFIKNNYNYLIIMLFFINEM